MQTFHHLRAWLLHRQADQLKQRVSTCQYHQSAHQTGSVVYRNAVPPIHRSAWFALATIVIAYGAGYVSADDKRIEREQQEQVSALCSQPWPYAPGAIEARRRACPLRKQS
ncbi:hypothetical protein [Herminiimonas sp. CN]|uniref:hypothetical protein n=1 Tax=Herminiimonas sp. CN TaxID=1349818 RepID=UPI0004739596|nr:hypothetical protein [Herminiimonas sp. CN]